MGRNIILQCLRVPFVSGEICQMLTAAGASVTVRNNRGETCLHRAAVGGHVEAVSAIVGRYKLILQIHYARNTYARVCAYVYVHYVLA